MSGRFLEILVFLGDCFILPHPVNIFVHNETTEARYNQTATREKRYKRWRSEYARSAWIESLRSQHTLVNLQTSVSVSLCLWSVVEADSDRPRGVTSSSSQHQQTLGDDPLLCPLQQHGINSHQTSEICSCWDLSNTAQGSFVEL